MGRKAWMVAGLVVTAAVAQATVMMALDLPALVEQSQVVVRGRVLDKVSLWNPAGTRIFTRSTVDVTETLKGPPASSVTLFSWGGTVGDVGQTVAGDQAPQAGLEAVFFLRRAPDPGTLAAVGMAQGIWPVGINAQGEATAFRKASPMVVGTPGGPTQSLVMLADPGEPATLYAELRQRVLALAQARP